VSARRRVVLLAYAALILEDASSAAFLPLAPTYATEFGLTKLETGALFAAVSFGLLVLSIPVGLLADRVGARPLTAAGCGVLALAALGQGLAGDFWTLLAARGANGVSHALLWTAALVWLADWVPPARRAAILGGTITVTGIGWIAAPALAGVLTEQVGRWLPFTVVAAGAVIVLAAILVAGPDGRAAHEHEPRSLRAWHRNVLIVGAIVIMVIDSVEHRIVTLLAPLQLDANGVSAASLGIVFSVAAALSVAVSGLTNRAGDRAVRLDLAGLATVVLGGVVVLFAVGTATPLVVGALFGSTLLSTLLITIVYPLGAAGAQRAGVGRGAVIGLLNVVSGGAAFLAPIVGGGVASLAGDRVAYLAVAGLTLATGALLFRAGRREARRAAGC